MKSLFLLFTFLIAQTAGGQPARPVTWPAPRYPDMLRSANVQGVVTAHIPVFADGVFGPIRFDRTSGYHELFAQAIRRAFDSTTFAPALRRGRPVDSEITVRVVFVLLRPATPPAAGDERYRSLDSLPDQCPTPSAQRELVVCARAKRESGILP